MLIQSGADLEKIIVDWLKIIVDNSNVFVDLSYSSLLGLQGRIRLCYVTVFQSEISIIFITHQVAIQSQVRLKVLKW